MNLGSNFFFQHHLDLGHVFRIESLANIHQVKGKHVRTRLQVDPHVKDNARFDWDMYIGEIRFWV